jgi:hypothetical protein
MPPIFSNACVIGEIVGSYRQAITHDAPFHSTSVTFSRPPAGFITTDIFDRQSIVNFKHQLWRQV